MDYATLRAGMVDDQILARGIRDARILEALRRVERHLFLPRDLWPQAYDDRPLPIGAGQTISQPYIVAYMLAAAKLSRGGRVLEIGTGSGYQTALLAELTEKVFSVEIIPSLAQEARRRLEAMGYQDVRSRCGDGYRGWPEEAPFDAIIVAAAAPEVPPALGEQLADGGRLVIPVGVEWQELQVIVKHGPALKVIDRVPVRFVPLVRASGEWTPRGFQE